MIPHHTLVGIETAPHLAFVMHGVLGAGHNFRSFIKKLAGLRPEYRFALIDLRYHGESRGAPPPHTLESCADDLFDLADHLGAHPRAVIGHSLGGKVALAFGRRHVDEVEGHRVADDNAHHVLRQIWALDSDPGAQKPDHDHQVLRVLGALQANPGAFSARSDAVSAIEATGLSSGLSQWLATNLERTQSPSGERYTWKLELSNIQELLTDYFSVDLWPFLEQVAALSRDDGSLLFDLVLAENSDRWSGSMKERAASLTTSGPLRVHALPDSGHWVHVDNPTGLLEILKTNLI